jgi:transposase-like protein
MPISAPSNPYKHHRFPAEIISHRVWWYFHFCLSYRDVEELLFAHGVIVTSEAIRRAENSHQPTRQRERRLQRFKSAEHAQRFLSAYGPIALHFRPRRHLFPAPEYRQEMTQRFQLWRGMTGTAMAA